MIELVWSIASVIIKTAAGCNKQNKGMCMMKLLVRFFAILAWLSCASTFAADAAEKPAMPKMLMYIQPIEYTNPIQLWHPYHGYWFHQGPVVEAQAMPKLTQAYGDVKLCDSNQSGRTLVWLQPRMFYNPQVNLFYAKVTANAYTGVGKLIGTYVGESKLHGFLDLMVEDRIAQSYALAVDALVAKMQADTALQTLLEAKDPVSASEAAPCSMVTLLPTPKIRVMSF